MDDPAVIVSGLRVVEEFSKVGFVSDFLRLRKSIRKFFKGNEMIASAAVFALRGLAGHGKMAVALIGKGFEELLARFETGEERRAARGVLDAIRNAE
jgi:hypothetical protein